MIVWPSEKEKFNLAYINGDNVIRKTQEISSPALSTPILQLELLKTVGAANQYFIITRSYYVINIYNLEIHEQEDPKAELIKTINLDMYEAEKDLMDVDWS